MGNYLRPFGKQIKEWLRRDCLISTSQNPEHTDFLGPVMIHKVIKIDMPPGDKPDFS